MFNYYFITVPGNYGYVIPVKSSKTENIHENIIKGAIKHNLFYDANEAKNAYVSNMTQEDVNHFSEPGMTIHDID